MAPLGKGPTPPVGGRCRRKATEGEGMLSAARLTEGLCAEQYEFAENLAEIDTFLCDNPSVTASPCHLPLHRGGIGRIPRR